MTNLDLQRGSSASADVLSAKDNALFKNMMDLYNNKSYKKALKIAETLLTKYPDHGETLSVKALLLLFFEPSRENEIIELAKRGLRNGINSYLCWHVLGVIYKHNKRYKETTKCFIMALKLDPHNDRLLREICCLQIELNDYSAFRRFASNQLKLKPKEYREWLIFAFSQHLCGNLKLSCEILEEANSLFSPSYKVESHELSESIMYRAMLYEHFGDFKLCADLLDRKADVLKDKLTYLEVKAKALYLANELKAANETYKKLIDLNSRNARYVFMYLLTHPNEKVRSLFLYKFGDYERPKTGSIYEERLRSDSDKFVKRKLELPKAQNYAVVLSDEILDLDGEYSSAGWSLENRLYHNFDKFIAIKNWSKEPLYLNTFSYPQFCYNISKQLDMSNLPEAESLQTFSYTNEVLDKYMADIEGSDFVVYSKYRKYLKRDKYPLYMFVRLLNKDEERLLLETIDNLGLKDSFTHHSFIFTFATGLNFYERAFQYITTSLDRASVNIFKTFAHALTFRKAYQLIFILTECNMKLIRRQRIDDLPNETDVKPAEHEVACNYRHVLVILFLAKLYDFMGAYSKALDVVNTGFRIAPTSVDLLCLRGKIMRHMGDFWTSNEDFSMASDIDRSDRQTSAKSAKSILRTYDFEHSVKRWKSFLVEDVFVKNEKEPPPEIPSFKFELMFARLKFDRYLKSRMNSPYDKEEAVEYLKESFDKYRSILEKHSEIYQNQLDFHNYCLNRLSYRVYYNFLKLRNSYCCHGYFIKALKGAIRTSIEMHELGEESDLEVERKFRFNHKNILYCLNWMKIVLTQRVFDPGLYHLFYKLSNICNLSQLFKLQCINRCFYSSRCDVFNHHLFQMVFDLIYNMKISCDLEMKLVKSTLETCVKEGFVMELNPIDDKLPDKYLNLVLEEVLSGNCDLKKVQALIVLGSNFKEVEFLRTLFSTFKSQLDHLTFKDYSKFKRGLMHVVCNCNNYELKNFLKEQLEVIDSTHRFIDYQ